MDMMTFLKIGKKMSARREGNVDKVQCLNGV